LAGLFDDDAAFVNVAGGYLRGRGEIEQVHAAGHAGPFKTSALTAWAEDARSLGPDVIIAHVRSELRGDDRVPGQARRSLLSLVIERRGSLGKIVAAHNTNVAVPSALPLAPANRYGADLSRPPCAGWPRKKG
jgi:uncharacterized protein (TIGR02246 family)